MAKYTDYELTVLMAYEKKLLGIPSNIVATFSSSDISDREKEKRALIILRYVFEDVFHWSPSDAEKYFTEEVIEKMKLKDIVKKITFPSEMNPEEKFYYYVWKVYPQHEKADIKERTLSVYRDVLAGKKRNLPKGFWTDSNGVFRATICLHEALASNFSYDSVQKYYELFSKSEGLTFLNKMRLMDACQDLYGDPISYLHNSLSDSDKSEFFYQYYYYQLLEKRKISRKNLAALFSPVTA